MSPQAFNSSAAEPLRLARRSWQLLHVDSTRAITTAEQVLADVAEGEHEEARAWALLTCGFHLMYFATPREALPALERAQQAFDALGDRAGHILAVAGLARALWRAGRFGESLERVLPLRDEGLRLLKNEQRSVLLNTIAGCYSVQGQSEQAFAYMYQALREARPAGGHGFDAVLHCNLAHELLQLGDYEEALRHIDQGIARCGRLKNPRLMSALLINRIISLSELGRAAEAMPDVQRVHQMPTDTSGRGAMLAHFETLAIAALRAGQTAQGSELLALALKAPRHALPDEHLELAVARALFASAHGQPEQALRLLEQAAPLAAAEDTEGLSLRMRCSFYLTLADAQEYLGRAPQALASMRQWQCLQTARANLASRARYQAAALQTELLRLQHKLEENEAHRRATERARGQLQAANEALSRRVEEVQALRAALQEQAVRDALTGLFNRRHLNDTLPALLALARREVQPLAVVIIDLDHFKSINDNHGHAAGDRLLAAFGRLLGGHLRQSDVACRYGGEEFCLLMPSTPAPMAAQKVGELLEGWRDASSALEIQALEGLSFSAGVADSTQVPGSAEALLNAADTELLKAKRHGRNRVLSFTSASEEHRP